MCEVNVCHHIVQVSLWCLKWWWGKNNRFLLSLFLFLIRYAWRYFVTAALYSYFLRSVAPVVLVNKIKLRSSVITFTQCSCGSVVEHCVSSANGCGFDSQRTRTLTQTCITWMHCESLWIKASAKCIKINVMMSVFFCWIKMEKFIWGA